jgi:hypothetical protein
MLGKASVPLHHTAISPNPEGRTLPMAHVSKPGGEATGICMVQVHGNCLPPKDLRKMQKKTKKEQTK